MDWGALIRGAGQVVQGLSDVAVVDNWLKMSDEGAFRSIATQVETSPVEVIDRLDMVLCAAAVSYGSEENRLRLVRFYTVFKISETMRFEEFRGFPQ